MFIVFDMDGTLSDPSHRTHYLTDANPPNWDAFYNACYEDTPNRVIIALFKALWHDGHEIEIWTGRRESCRADTISWLDRHELPLVPVRMRSKGDKRHDTVVKGEFMAQHGRPSMVFEDRNSTVEYFRDLNIRCIQVAPGDF